MKEEKVEGAKYLTSFISYMFNYFLISLSVFFLFLLFREFNLRIVFRPENFYETLPVIFFFGILALISYLIQEPIFERMIRQYYVSDNEITKVEGIITKKRVVIPYQNVADIKLNQGLVARIFNYGDIIISGFKESIVVKGIKNPYPLYKQIKEKVSASTKSKNNYV
jgi:membrane protein YdbS with pleckstrin-like domain